jgi:ribonuclease HI
MSVFFGVNRGRKTGVYPSWDQAELFVSGYPGAVFKKFKTHAQAQHFVDTGEIRHPKSKILEGALRDNGELHIYTDGSYSHKTKRSGAGVAWGHPFTYMAMAKRLPDGTSNQRAELQGIRMALAAIDKTTEVARYIVEHKGVIWTDSDYACRCLADYIHRWRENGWITGSGNPVKHKRLIQECSRLLTKLRHVRLRHISEVGFSSHATQATIYNAPRLTQKVWEGNKRADELATGK